MTINCPLVTRKLSYLKKIRRGKELARENTGLGRIPATAIAFPEPVWQNGLFWIWIQILT